MINTHHISNFLALCVAIYILLNYIFFEFLLDYLLEMLETILTIIITGRKNPCMFERKFIKMLYLLQAKNGNYSFCVIRGNCS